MMRKNLLLFCLFTLLLGDNLFCFLIVHSAGILIVSLFYCCTWQLPITLPRLTTTTTTTTTCKKKEKYGHICIIGTKKLATSKTQDDWSGRWSVTRDSTSRKRFVRNQNDHLIFLKKIRTKIEGGTFPIHLHTLYFTNKNTIYIDAIWKPLKPWYLHHHPVVTRRFAKRPRLTMLC